ncbi:MAG: BlaI/MecI/CopY family transcriptional regulator [Christensenellaceae bacterium]|nr:BlaI/MecI/CopY family transcriptional regulator [Christensenellaceae bacterium]
MKGPKSLSSAELEIMQVFWREGKGMTAQEILSKMPEKNWRIETLLTFLSRLSHKGTVSSVKVPVARRRPHSLFSAGISRLDYAKWQDQIHIDKYHDGDAEDLVKMLLDEGLITKECLLKIAAS